MTTSTETRASLDRPVGVERVLQTLKECSRTKKELKRVLKATRPPLKKKYTKKALRYLVESGKVKKHGKEYRLSNRGPLASFPATASSPKPILSSIKMDQSAIPIGMKLRGSKVEKKLRFNDESTRPSFGGDIDDEIARLEKELMDGTGEPDDSGSSSEEEELPNAKKVNEKTGSSILSLSSFADDRVESLPPTCLPVPGKYSLSKKKGNVPKNSQRPQVKSGLQKAVEEVLGGYTARSSEKIPFYCRFCSKKYENETSFNEHKTSEFHKTAVALERKATYCKLCRKQLTSPTQMKEHLSSRPHRQRLQDVRRRQQGRY